MEISSVLKHESQNGKKPVKHIEFKGERLDTTSVHQCTKALEPGSP